MTDLGQGGRQVVAIVQMPPPVTGLSAVNAAMVDVLESRQALSIAVNIGPAPGLRGPRKAFDRSRKTFVAGVRLIAARGKGARTLYMPCDGGSGIIFNIVLVCLAHILGFQVWIHHHSFAYINRRTKLMALLIRMGPNHMQHIALCDAMLDQFAARYAPEWKSRLNGGVVLPNTFMIDGSAKAAPATEVFTIGHLSNLTVSKGAVRFIEIFYALKSRGVQVRARIAGPLDDEAVGEAIREASQKHPSDFEWIGPVYGEAKARFFQDIDAFVFPSDYVNEAQPLVLIEALAHGAVVLATRRGCMECDHAHSPGLVTALDNFHSEAVGWIELHANGWDRPLRAAASDRFRSMKRDADMSLEALISRL